jgi:hypothetical protein
MSNAYIPLGELQARYSAAPPPARASVPIGAEARGKLRIWKRTLVEPDAKIQGAMVSPEFRQLATDYVYKRGKGQERALTRLNRLVSPALLVGAFETGGAVWGWLEPSEAVLNTDDPGRSQDCVLVSYIAAAKFTRRGDAARCGGWFLEAPDHALGRLLQRCPQADPAAALWLAAEAFLNAGMGEIVTCVKDRRVFYLPAGDGLFLCEAIASNGCLGRLMYARARTWLPDDMLRPEQKSIGAAQPEESMRMGVVARLLEC